MRHHISIIKISLIAFIVLACVGCSKPGYNYIIKVQDISPANIGELENAIEAKGLNVVSKKRDTLSRSRYISEFWKDMPEERKYYFISITMFYSKYNNINELIPLELTIKNQFHGSEDSMKSEIDELGDFLYGQILKSVNKEKIIVEKKFFSPPLFY